MNYVNELRHLADSLGDVNPYWCDADVDMLREAAARLAEAEKLLREAREGNGHTPDWWRRVDATLKAAKGGRDGIS